ncbi:hypothetical protein [Saccharopolyspora sp. 6M]|uniref:YunG family protein n=1 Tax=Saccharopolyspora sp. 6M TaxID=2877237 RepID=UPI001CD5E6F4|nr:hypothetical protein [Saccharopolyspora sp. 6M]MCA1229933.1 hypothetical protein [Saccharopolyspora sp. 6M]
MPMTLTGIEHAFRCSWGADTCAPEDLSEWSPRNPARGQCGVTALVLQDFLGGELLRGEVLVAGARVDFHWWNLLGSVEVDLTREQFAPEEVVGPGEVVVRGPLRRMQAEYELLRERVRAHLSSAC